MSPVWPRFAFPIRPTVGPHPSCRLGSQTVGVPARPPATLDLPDLSPLWIKDLLTSIDASASAISAKVTGPN